MQEKKEHDNNETVDHLTQLPIELLTSIFYFLNSIEIARTRPTSKILSVIGIVEPEIKVILQISNFYHSKRYSDRMALRKFIDDFRLTQQYHDIKK